MTKEEFILDEFGWYLTMKEEGHQFSMYWPAFRKTDGFNAVFMSTSVYDEPPDAGWRIYLGMVLLRLKDKALQIKKLEDFYHYWCEMF
jgi:hypothetical protein